MVTLQASVKAPFMNLDKEQLKRACLRSRERIEAKIGTKRCIFNDRSQEESLKRCTRKRFW